MSVLTWDLNPLPIKARLGLVPFSPLDNYIVAHLVDCVNIFFMFFYVFLSSEKAVLLYRVPLATLLTAFLCSPLDNYNYNDFFQNVNTFFKSYFFNDRSGRTKRVLKQSTLFSLACVVRYIYK